VTVQASARRPVSSSQLLGLLADFYDGSTFVQVQSALPRIKEVATSNFAQISGVAEGGQVAVMCAIDNLVKGAAGGAVQWMNRLFGLDEATGLNAPAPGWT
jgi:N-acetyl-gamma-glutamyl-phosphate reductase